jgi:PadR family transcriptional regulator, phenolic acid-responsive transcriptional regulator
MSLDHILLGLLREPASGYDLKAVFDTRIHYFWPAELSQVYPALQKLEAKGLLRSREAPAKRGPRRRVYQTTAAGHRVLQQWLNDSPELGDERVGFLAKIYLMDELGDLGRTLQYFRELREMFATRLEKLVAIERGWAAREPKYPDALSPQMFHVSLTLRKGLCSLAAHVKWCSESVRRIEDRLEKEKSNVRTVSRPSLGAHRGRNHRADRVLGPRSRKQGRPAAR